MIHIDGKRYLYSIRDEQGEIDILKDRIYQLEMSLYPTGIAYDKDKVQTTLKDRFSDTMVDMVDYEKQLQDKLTLLTNRRKRAQSCIDKIDSSIERQILEFYFLSGKKVKFAEIGPRIGYSKTQASLYYKLALSDFEYYLNSEPNRTEAS